MRELVTRYLHHSLSRRGFVRGLTKAGLTATAAQSVLGSVSSVSLAQEYATMAHARLAPRNESVRTLSVTLFQETLASRARARQTKQVGVAPASPEGASVL